MVKFILLISIFLLMIHSATAQKLTRDQMNQRYKVSSTDKYIARADVLLEVKFDKQNFACQINIKPIENTENKNASANPMLLSTINEIIDDLIPVAQRGILKSKGKGDYGGVTADIFDYENVSIVVFYDGYSSNDVEAFSATIQWHHCICKNSKKKN